MDPLGWTILGSAVAVLGLIYLMVVGDRPLAEWFRDKRRRASSPSQDEKNAIASLWPAHNLPPRGVFVGRKQYVQDALDALRSSYPIISIEGLGGVGKTALAIQVAHACVGNLLPTQKQMRAKRTSLFDAAVWMTARENQLELENVLDSIARVLGQTSVLHLPVTDKRFEVNMLLKNRKCLVIIDNFEMVTDKSIVEFLRGLPEPSRALITTRQQTLMEARPLCLHGLGYDETTQLIAEEVTRLSLSSLEFSEDARKEIYERTGGIPLAIKWAMGQMKQRGQSLSSVLDDLYCAQGDLFAFMFDRACSFLTGDAMRALMTLPMFRSNASRAAISAVSGLHDLALTSGLGLLVELSLVELQLPGHRDGDVYYAVHPLVRAYAQQKQIEHCEFVTSARDRLIIFYRDLVTECGGNELGSRPRYDRLSKELDNIEGIIEWCLANDHWKETKEIADALMTFLSVDGYWEMRAKLCRKLIDVARLKQDKAAEGLFLGRLAFILAYRGDFQAAWSIAEKAILASEEVYCEARSLAWDTMSLVLLWSDDPSIPKDVEKARAVREHALAVHLAAQDEYWITIDHLVLGKIAIGAKDFEAGRQHFENAVQCAESIDYQKARGQALSELGYLYVLTGQSDLAEGYLAQAMAIASEWRDLRVQALTQWYQAKLQVVLGNRHKAQNLLIQARDIGMRLGMKREVEGMDGDMKELRRGQVPRLLTALRLR
jgi:tetratricopeptide (TPR) repeat protein